ncbi:MAG: iron-sulfur cluster assembly protein, partial [Thermaurantiacus sp.]
MSTITDADVRAALAGIHDPCSVAAGRPTNLVDMGLMIGWQQDGERLALRLAVTFAGCTMAPHFAEAARAALAELPGITEVEVAVDSGFVWTPERMAVPARPMEGTPRAWEARGR